MTLTEAPPATVEPSVTPEPESGLYGVVTSTDHKTVGKLYVGFALLFGLVALVVGALAAIEGVDPDSFDIFSDADGLAQATSLLWTVGFFGSAIPLLIGLAAVVVPLQVGSPAVAFPRALAASFWTWLIGAFLLGLGYALDGGLGASAAGSDSEAVALSVAAMGMVAVALMLALVCLVTTVIALRPEGMSLSQVPFFGWSMLVAGAFWLASMPVLVANVLVAYVDLRGRPAIFTGSEDSIAGQFDWFFTPPQALLVLVPVLGIVADIVQASIRGRQRNYGLVLGGIAVFGLLSYAADMQTAFDYSISPVTSEFLYLAGGIAIILPFLVVLGGILDSLIVGRLRIGTPSPSLLAALITFDLVAAAVVTAVLRSIEPLDLVGTPADRGVAVLALTGALCGALAGWIHWGPKFTGRPRPSGLAVGATAGLLVGGAVAGLALFVAGFFDPGESVLDTLSALTAVGLLIAAVAVGGALVALVVQIGGPESDDDGESEVDVDDGGVTLEWAAPTPPPLGNFAEPVGPVASPQPLLDTDDGDES